MKYPLHIGRGVQPDKTLVVDAAGKIVLSGEDTTEVWRLAKLVVWVANLRWRLFGQRKPYTRNDWLRERA